jgi:hypothetical protein
MPTRVVLPFVVETGSGALSATSYVSVLDADLYLDHIPDALTTVWRNSSVFEKQQLLVWATQLLDQYVYFPNSSLAYDNRRVSQGQALNFPRVGMVDADGYVIDSHSIPPFIKNATIQMSYELSKLDRTVEPTRGIVSASVGPLSVTFDENYSHSTRVIPRSVLAILAPFGGCLRGGLGIKSMPVYRA